MKVGKESDRWWGCKAGGAVVGCCPRGCLGRCFGGEVERRKTSEVRAVVEGGFWLSVLFWILSPTIFFSFLFFPFFSLLYSVTCRSMVFFLFFFPPSACDVLFYFFPFPQFFSLSFFVFFCF